MFAVEQFTFLLLFLHPLSLFFFPTAYLLFSLFARSPSASENIVGGTVYSPTFSFSLPATPTLTLSECVGALDSEKSLHYTSPVLWAGKEKTGRESTRRGKREKREKRLATSVDVCVCWWWWWWLAPLWPSHIITEWLCIQRRGGGGHQRRMVAPSSKAAQDEVAVVNGSNTRAPPPPARPLCLLWLCWTLVMRITTTTTTEWQQYGSSSAIAIHWLLPPNEWWRQFHLALFHFVTVYRRQWQRHRPQLYLAR